MLNSDAISLELPKKESLNVQMRIFAVDYYRTCTHCMVLPRFSIITSIEVIVVHKQCFGSFACVSRTVT